MCICVCVRERERIKSIYMCIYMCFWHEFTALLFLMLLERIFGSTLLLPAGLTSNLKASHGECMCLYI